MTISIKDLGTGQLANTKGTLYTTPASTQAIAKTITVVNTDSSARTINLYVQKDGTNSRRFIPVDLSVAIGAVFTWEGVITLEAADLIEGDASVASKLDYVINGVEEA